MTSEPRSIASLRPALYSAGKRVQFGYGLNYLIDVEHAIILDVEPTPARTYDEVASTRTMLERTEPRLDLKPDWIPPTALANCLRGCWARTSRRISSCGKGIHRLMACSPLATSLMTRSGMSTFVPMARCCEPQEQSMTAASGTTCSQPQDCRACTLKQRCTQSCPFTEGHAGV
jgi:hypothetical protein